MMKQAGVFFIIFAFLYLMINRFRIHGALLRLFLKQGFLFSAGAIIPFMLTCGILLIAGVFEKFWFWTFSYASEYGSQVTLSEGSKIFLTQASEVMGNFYLLWGMAGIGISALFWDRTRRTHNTFLLGFSLFSFLAVCPGLYFREHYFVLILPAAACLMGIAISSLRNQILKFEPGWQFFPTLLFLIVFLLGVYSYRSFFFELSPFQACRMMYGSNPFPESIEISNYIRAHSQEQDKIAILVIPQLRGYGFR
jgi:hypothetical protein